MLRYACSGALSHNGKRSPLSECAPCECATTIGWWADTVPEGWTHDRATHVSFPATNTWGSCSACGNIFKGIANFDHHQADGKRSWCAKMQALGIDATIDVAALSGGMGRVERGDDGLYGAPSYNYQRLYHEKGGFYYFGAQKMEE